MAKKVKTKADIEAEVRIHVEAEKKAHFLVEHLVMVEKVKENELDDILDLIMVHHYHDITEERSIAHICGYPLCSNQLPKRKKQQFHISLKQQKVYDISERLFFCSDFCFKASKFIERQIPTAPIWLRSKKEKLKFLYEDEKVEVKITRDGDIEECNEEEDPRNVKKQSYERFDEFDKESSEKKKSPTKAPTVAGKTGTKQTKVLENKDNELIANIEKLQANLLQWFEGFNNEKFKRDRKPELQNTHTNIKAEGDFQMKALNFLCKNPDWSNESTLSEDFKQKMNMHYMPPVDSKSQGVLRKKIVKEQVFSSLNKLQPIIGFNKSDYVRLDFFSFIEKLNFNRENIVLKPKEWITITVCLLKIYSHKHDDLRLCLNENDTRLDEYFERINSPIKMNKLEIICDKVMKESKMNDGIEENESDESDGDESDDDYSIFPDTCASNLSTICEYEDFEELD